MRCCLRVLVVLACCLTVGACASGGIGRMAQFKPGQSSMRDVRASMGQPSAIWFDRDGRENWDFSANMFSFYGYSARFDGDGTLVEWRQLRTEREYARLVPGRSTGYDVREAFGEPHTLYFVRGEPHWEWLILHLGQRYRLVAQFDRAGALKAVARYPAGEAGGGRGG